MTYSTSLSQSTLPKYEYTDTRNRNYKNTITMNKKGWKNYGKIYIM